MRSHCYGGVAAAIALAIGVSLPVLLDAQAPAGGGQAAAKPAPPPAGPPPRLPNGQINLGAVPGQKGFWNSFNGQIIGKTGNSLPTNLTIEEVPLRPWARALYEYRDFRDGLDDPHARCQPAGGLRFLTAPNGTEFIQQPELNRIIMIDGENRDWKRIAMEPGRKHPSMDELNPSYFGDSIGRWEGDTLVVDTVGFNEKFWAFRNGLPHTRFLHLTERYTRIDMNRIRFEFTVDDPGAYTRTWSGGWHINWQSTNYDNSPNGEIHEYFCIDNERDSEHLER
ncbi:MAG TPA: hypothetical protein VM818_10915 [Vicinamibacterales bacterium]|jgi:hypothetical protein|nr:hypothetical protein [Vicinamibacterales bacterium]